MVRRTMLGVGLLLLAVCRDGAGPHKEIAFTQVSTGVSGPCALTPAGAAYCWGYNGLGELGTGSATGPALCAGKFPCSDRPAAVSGGLTFAGVSAGATDFACGVTTAGAGYCWGDNSSYSLGSGDTASSSRPVRVAGGLTFALVQAGYRHVCGLTAAGAAYCWGLNYRGQLGNGNTTNSMVPVAVSGGLTFTSLSAGLDNACGVTADGAAYCWGYNAYGKLGSGDTTTRGAPVAVVGGLAFASVSTGLFHTCGVTTGGAAYCWGSNFAGELGTGDTSFSSTPVRVTGGLRFATISAGWWFTCGVTTSGVAYCWGWNDWGQAGIGGTCYTVPTPMAVIGGLAFATVSAGEYDTCGVTTDGAAYCWGDNANGQLGDGSTVFSSGPMRVASP